MDLDKDIDEYLKLIEANPEKNKKILMKYESGNENDDVEEL